MQDTAPVNALAWIIGRGGLLGSSFARAVDRQEGVALFRPPVPRFSWSNSDLLNAELSKATEAFAAELRNGYASWEVYWAAGRCSMCSEQDELAGETRVLRDVLTLLNAHPILRALPGTFMFASSAGGIYAGTDDDVITENTPPAPLSSYSIEKLAQEAIVRDWAIDRKNTSVLIARFSTLYGPDQSTTKRQGLLTHIARCILQKKPINIFVPLDTIRDYMHVNDATACCMNTLEHVRGSGRVLMKIIAAEEPATIARIIDIFTEVTGAPPHIVKSADPMGKLYPRHMRFRSTVALDAAPTKRIGLPSGIAELFAHESKTLQANA